MGREVKYVKLHGGDAFIPGVGSLSNTLPPSNKVVAGLYMTAEQDGILVRAKVLDPRNAQAGTVDSGGFASALIPWANVQLAVYSGAGPEDTTKPNPNKLEVKYAIGVA